MDERLWIFQETCRVNDVKEVHMSIRGMFGGVLVDSLPEDIGGGLDVTEGERVGSNKERWMAMVASKVRLGKVGRKEKGEGDCLMRDLWIER